MPGYSSVAMDHFSAPRNQGRMAEPDAVGRASLSGRAPRITFYLQVCGGVLRRATFETAGCGAAIACCSLLTELVAEKTLTHCRQITPEMLDEALDGLPANRRYCATVAVCALREALLQLDEQES